MGRARAGEFGASGPRAGGPAATATEGPMRPPVGDRGGFERSGKPEYGACGADARSEGRAPQRRRLAGRSERLSRWPDAEGSSMRCHRRQTRLTEYLRQAREAVVGSEGPQQGPAREARMFARGAPVGEPSVSREARSERRLPRRPDRRRSCCTVRKASAQRCSRRSGAAFLASFEPRRPPQEPARSKRGASGSANQCAARTRPRPRGALVRGPSTVGAHHHSSMSKRLLAGPGSALSGDRSASARTARGGSATDTGCEGGVVATRRRAYPPRGHQLTGFRRRRSIRPRWLQGPATRDTRTDALRRRRWFRARGPPRSGDRRDAVAAPAGDLPASIAARGHCQRARGERGALFVREVVIRRLGWLRARGELGTQRLVGVDHVRLATRAWETRRPGSRASRWCGSRCPRARNETVRGAASVAMVPMYERAGAGGAMRASGRRAWARWSRTRGTGSDRATASVGKRATCALVRERTAVGLRRRKSRPTRAHTRIGQPPLPLKASDVPGAGRAVGVVAVRILAGSRGPPA